MNESNTCPNCGAAIPADAPENVCPACALGRGLGPEAAAMAADEATFRRAELDTLGAAFPQFELLEMLGRGGMGEVYKARQKKLNRLVAIKILPEPFGKLDEFTERFHREAQSLARLNHPNIVTIYDYGEANGLCYFVMEFVDGVDLRRMIEARTLTPEDALRIVPQVCDALQFAHDQGIVHRDVKPANILIDRTGRVKIADFGLAKIVGKSPTDLTLTAIGDVMGTAEYMAPEQRRASQAVDHRADIYSLGVVFYEMLTGEVPMGRFEPPSHKVRIDVRLDDVVLRTLEREPERRYQKASEVKSGVETVTSASAPAVAKPARRFPVRFAALWTLLFAATWWAILAFWNWRAWGVVAGGCALAMVIGAALFHGRRHFPIIAEQWQRASVFSKLHRIVLAAGQSIAVVALVWGATLSLTERMQSAFTYLEADKFAARHKGEEFKLLRQLTAFKTDIPKAELVSDGWNWSGGLAILSPTPPWRGSYFTWTGILVQLGIAALLLANTVNAVVGTYLFRLRADPHWRRTTWPIAVLTCALLAGGIINQIVATFAQMMPYGFTMTSSEPVVAAPLTQVEKVVSAQVKADGFAVGESRQWQLVSVPEGRFLGRVRIANAWKPSPFDRWEWRAGRLTPIAPQIALRYLSTDSPPETRVKIDVAFQTRKPTRGVDPTLIPRIEAAAKSAQGSEK
jgi:tRNA A-37 threonylcarbamoyl transferase component Bud32